MTITKHYYEDFFFDFFFFYIPGCKNVIEGIAELQHLWLISIELVRCLQLIVVKRSVTRDK